MFIVDSQVHIWGDHTPQHPWKGHRKPHRDAPLGAEELLREMDAAGVARAIIVSPSWDSRPNELALSAAQQYPERFAVMGLLDIRAPGADTLIANWRLHTGMLGLRCSFSKPPWPDDIAEGRLDWFWSAAQEARLPIMAIMPQTTLHLIDTVAARYPGLKLVVDHLGLTSGQSEEDAFRDFDKLLPLSRRPNIAVKASALPAYTRDAYPYRRLHPYLRRTYDAFGPKRMFWGTDLARLPCSYAQAISMFTDEIPWLTADDKKWIMGHGLCAWLGWDSAG